MEMQKVIDYLAGVRQELSQVVWPKRDEVIKLTLVVIIISAAVGAYMGGLDYLFTKALELLVI